MSEETPAPAPAPEGVPIDQAPTPPAPVAREWMQALPPELQADPTLARFETVESLAKGHIEAHKVAKGKLAIPASDAPPEAWDPIYEALGRPKDAAEYDLPLPEGAPTALADAFRPVAHKLGLNAAQAKGIAEFNNAQQEAAIAADAATLEAFKAEKGADYPAIEEAAKNAFKAMGLDVGFAEGLARLTNSAALISGFAAIAEKIGEHKRVVSDDPVHELNGVPDSQAEAKLQALQKNPEWRAKYQNKDPMTLAERARLLEAAQRFAARG